MYLDLALARMGVCRHRSYAFVITALGLGVRARMVLNEAHAWVEVADGLQWKRIDLGGAGALLEQEQPDSKSVTYRPPPDSVQLARRRGSRRGPREDHGPNDFDELVIRQAQPGHTVTLGERTGKRRRSWRSPAEPRLT